MSLNKVFSKSSLAVSKKTLALATYDSIRSLKVFTPPRNRISLQEKIALGSLMSLGALIIPAWVLYHVPEYQKDTRRSGTPS